MTLFEAVFGLCLAAGEPCRDILVPGYEAESLAACNAALIKQPPSADARCVAAGPSLPVTEAAAGVFLHRGEVSEADTKNGGDISNLGFVIGDNSVAVIDSGGAAWVGEALWRTIRAKTDLPISHLILTHMHPDHVYGAAVFDASGVNIVGHQGLGRALAERQESYAESLTAAIGAGQFIGSRVVTVDVGVADQMDIDLGGRVLTLQAWPVAHTATDLTVYDQTSGILFAGDLVFAEHTPSLDGSLRGWQAVLKKMREIPATNVVPGHGGPLLDWPDGADANARYLDVLAGDILTAISDGARLSDVTASAAQSEAGNWELFDAFNPRNVTVGFAELEWE